MKAIYCCYFVFCTKEDSDLSTVGVDEIIGQFLEARKTKTERQGVAGRKKSYKMSVGCYQDPLGLDQSYLRDRDLYCL